MTLAYMIAKGKNGVIQRTDRWYPHNDQRYGNNDYYVEVSLLLLQTAWPGQEYLQSGFQESHISIAWK